MKNVEKATIIIEANGQPKITLENKLGVKEERPFSVVDLITLIQKGAGVTKTFVVKEGLLATDLYKKIILWRPPEITLLALETNKRSTKYIRVPLPGLIMKRKPSGIFMAAFKGTKKPEAATPIFLPPLSNTSDNGDVCMGSTRTSQKDVAFPVDLDFEMLWKDFFSSAFTSHSCSGLCKTYPKDVRLLLFELEGKDKFPESELVQMTDHRSFASWIEG